MRTASVFSRSLPALFLPLLAVCLTACGQAGTTAAATDGDTVEARPIDVPVVTVGLSDLESVLQLSGTLTPQTRVGVKSTLAGTLASVTVNIGDRVRAGQVLATLDRRELDAQVDATLAAVNVTRAGLESAEAALASALLERDRAQKLFDSGAVARQQLDTAETVFRAATAQRELARATLAQADASHRRSQEVQRDATITSPIAGVIVERNFDAGSLVSPGTERPILVVADLSILKLQAGVSEFEAGRLRVGMPARITVQAKPGEMFDGRVAAIAPEVDARNRHFAVEVRMANTAGTLLSGMFGVAAIPLESAVGALAVPRDAVVSRGGDRMAMKVTGDTVVATPVAEGLSTGSQIQITQGLSAGDVILADARREVPAGTRVNPIPVR